MQNLAGEALLTAVMVTSVPALHEAHAVSEHTAHHAELGMAVFEARHEISESAEHLVQHARNA